MSRVEQLSRPAPAGPLGASRSSPRPPTRPAFMSPRERVVRAGIYGAIGLGLVYIFSTVYAAQIVARHAEAARLRIDLSPLLAADWTIQAHVAAALAAFLIGIAILLQRKGSRWHRTLGWTWSAAMGVTALASFLFLLRGHNLSWIHGFSALVLVLTPLGLWAARRHQAKLHAGVMVGMFLGGMLGAGLFTFLPGRLMWTLFFGAAPA